MKFLGETRSGSEGGLTASRNRFGQYIRRRAVPVNPSSPAQAERRAQMATNAAAWRLLSDAQRAGWKSLGLSMTRTDSLGQTYNLDGFLAYCSVNNNNAVAGVALESNAPILTTPDAIASATITLTDVAFSVAWLPTPLGSGQQILIYASPQMSAGRAFNADYRFIATAGSASTSPQNVLTAYTAVFGVPVTGNRIFLSISVFELGFVSAPLLVSQVVA